MRQPNIHHLRRFMEKTSSVNAAGSTPVSNTELLNVALALNDLLLYQRELETENQDLKQQIEDAGETVIEMVGEKF